MLIGLRANKSMYKTWTDLRSSVRLHSGVRIRNARFFTKGQVLHDAQFSNRLLSQAKEVGIEAIGHPFHKEIVNGSLCRKRFERYIIEDIKYLEGCIRIFEIAKERFVQQEELFELLIEGVNIGLVKFKDWERNYRINRELHGMNNAREVYVKFLMDVAQQGELVEIIGSLWPCFFLFREMYHIHVKELEYLTCAHPYYEYVKCFKDLVVSQRAERMKQELDNLFNNADLEEKTRLKKAFLCYFYQSLDHERRFFDSIYAINE